MVPSLFSEKKNVSHLASRISHVRFSFYVTSYLLVEGAGLNQRPEYVRIYVVLELGRVSPGSWWVQEGEGRKDVK